MMHNRIKLLPQTNLQAGMTLVEMLIALGILATVLLVTSSGIVQGLQVNRLQEEATNTQSKLRRITEVVSQDLRSAVLGGITDFPVGATSDSISFALLAGDGGVTVLPRPGNSWNNSENTLVHASDPAALTALVGAPAVMLNGNGDALIIPSIDDVGGDYDRVIHHGCKISIDYDPSTRLFSAMALGFDYDPADKTLYQIMYEGGDLITRPFAFGLSRFEIAYEYSSAADTVVRSDPWRDSAGNPQPTFSAGGEEYDLSRLRLTLATEDSGSEVAREYVGYVELTGLGNSSRPVSTVTYCDHAPGGNNGGGDNGGGNDGGGDGGDDGDDGGGNDGGGNNGGGNNGGGNNGGGNNGGGNNGGGNNGGGNNGGGNDNGGGSCGKNRRRC